MQIPWKSGKIWLLNPVNHCKLICELMHSRPSLPCSTWQRSRTSAEFIRAKLNTKHKWFHKPNEQNIVYFINEEFAGLQKSLVWRQILLNLIFWKLIYYNFMFLAQKCCIRIWIIANKSHMDYFYSVLFVYWSSHYSFIL